MPCLSYLVADVTNVCFFFPFLENSINLESMEGIILIGLQASGKSSFVKKFLFDTHIRINLDMVRTRHREKLLFETCLQAKQSFVIDNTNPDPESRARYIPLIKEHNFRLKGFYFQSRLDDCLQRNANRDETKKVPDKAIIATYSKLILPSFSEGFDELGYVEVTKKSFKVSNWQDEV